MTKCYLSTPIATAAVLLMLAVSGCGKKKAVAPADSTASAPAAAAGTAGTKLSGAEGVRAALEKNDYDGMMAELLKMKMAVANDSQAAEFRTLSREVGMTLTAAAPNDPKAAEALKALSALSMGR